MDNKAYIEKCLRFEGYTISNTVLERAVKHLDMIDGGEIEGHIDNIIMVLVADHNNHIYANYSTLGARADARSLCYGIDVEKMYKLFYS